MWVWFDFDALVYWATQGIGLVFIASSNACLYCGWNCADWVFMMIGAVAKI
jgi:hypothetical protein